MPLIWASLDSTVGKRLNKLFHNHWIFRRFSNLNFSSLNFSQSRVYIDSILFNIDLIHRMNSLHEQQIDKTSKQASKMSSLKIQRKSKCMPINICFIRYNNRFDLKTKNKTKNKANQHLRSREAWTRHRLPHHCPTSTRPALAVSNSSR